MTARKEIPGGGEERIPCAPLSYEDEPWLDAIGLEDVSDTWLQIANVYLISGRCQEVLSRNHVNTQARAGFYEDLLHADDPDSPIAKGYAKLVKHRDSGIPIDRFVANMRQVHANGMNVASTFCADPEVFGSPPNELKAFFDKANEDPFINYRVSLRPTRPRPNQRPNMSFARRTQIERLSEALGWPSQNVDTLANIKASVFAYTAIRTSLQARLLAHYANASITPRQVANIAIVNPDKQIIAVTTGIKSFTLRNIISATKDLSKVEAHLKAKEIIEAGPSELVPADIIRAFVRWHKSLQRRSL